MRQFFLTSTAHALSRRDSAHALFPHLPPKPPSVDLPPPMALRTDTRGYPTASSLHGTPGALLTLLRTACSISASAMALKLQVFGAIPSGHSRPPLLNRPSSAHAPLCPMAFTSLVTLLAVAAASVRAAPAIGAVCPDGTHVGHAACCAFIPLGKDLQENIFQNECGEDAHEALRLTFHSGGGADGRMLLFPTCMPELETNNGIDDSVNNLLPILARHPVSSGDLVQFAGAVAVSNCPELQDPVTTVLERFAHAGNFSPFEVISLLASHSVARADTHVDLPRGAAEGHGLPRLGQQHRRGDVAAPDTGELRLESDFNLAHDPRTACFWQGFVNEQERMAVSFLAAMAKLAALGHSHSDLIDS
ncbi:heme peroxidase [Mycena sp. CBHHK59/15]|nr:heme peroxidase [Mycena sp. CBHHK59/15]